MSRTIAVLGAGGYTGRFLLQELVGRGLEPRAWVRDHASMSTLRETHPSMSVGVADIADPVSVRRTVNDADVVINCAGPFTPTAGLVLDATIKAGAHYVDVSAEQRVVEAMFTRGHDLAITAGVTVLPATAYFGAFADMLLSVAMGDWASADDVRFAYALSTWHPTRGTRRTSTANVDGHRLLQDRRLINGTPDPHEWTFPEPMGRCQMDDLNLAEIVLAGQRRGIVNARSYINRQALVSVRDPTSPGPVPADSSGLSDQTFGVDVQARRGRDVRRAYAAGQDIYALSATLAALAAIRLLEPSKPPGTWSAARVLDPMRTLLTLPLTHLTHG